MPAHTNPLILASSSPRRQELLALTGVPFEIFVPEVDETCSLPPREAVADIRRTILDNDELYDDEREKLLYETEYHSCYLNDIDYHIGVVIITAEDIDDCYGAELDGIHDDFIVTYDETTDTYTTT